MVARPRVIDFRRVRVPPDEQEKMIKASRFRAAKREVMADPPLSGEQRARLSALLT